MENTDHTQVCVILVVVVCPMFFLLHKSLLCFRWKDYLSYSDSDELGHASFVSRLIMMCLVKILALKLNSTTFLDFLLPE